MAHIKIRSSDVYMYTNACSVAYDHYSSKVEHHYSEWLKSYSEEMDKIDKRIMLNTLFGCYDMAKVVEYGNALKTVENLKTFIEEYSEMGDIILSQDDLYHIKDFI